MGLLKKAFWGACIVGACLIDKDTYYRANHTLMGEQDIIRARVENVVKVADGPGEHGGYYKVYTDQGTFNTYSIRDGGRIKKDETYTFIVKGCEFSIMPPAFSRNIQWMEKSQKRNPRIFGDKGLAK